MNQKDRDDFIASLIMGQVTLDSRGLISQAPDGESLGVGAGVGFDLAMALARRAPERWAALTAGPWSREAHYQDVMDAVGVPYAAPDR